MNSLLLLVPISLCLLGLALWAFAWAVKRGQFDDLETPALDILREERSPSPCVETPAPAMPHADRPRVAAGRTTVPGSLRAGQGGVAREAQHRAD